MAAYSQTDKDRVQELEVKKKSLNIQGVSKSFTQGEKIDRDADPFVFDQVFESGADIADTGSHTDEPIEVSVKRDRTIEPEFWVGPNGDDTEEGSRNKPFATIDKAVSFLKSDFAANADKKVHVMSGDFAENITIDFDNLELVGKGPLNTTMDDLTVQGGVSAEVEDIKVRNLTVSQADTTLWLEDFEVGADVVIDDTAGIAVSADSMRVGGTVTDAGVRLSEFSQDISAL